MKESRFKTFSTDGQLKKMLTKKYLFTKFSWKIPVFPEYFDESQANTKVHGKTLILMDTKLWFQASIAG
jgi:hypothetical protein